MKCRKLLGVQKQDSSWLAENKDCIRAPPRRGRDWEIHPRRPKDFPRPKRFPEGEARGKSRGSREIWRAEGMDFPIPPEFWWSTDNLSASIFLQGVDQKILPCGLGRIDSVKINPSLLMMTDCFFPIWELQFENCELGFHSESTRGRRSHTQKAKVQIVKKEIVN